ncbi:MAG: FAD-dependent monooxygenase [Betaproteobacteria bacterium]|jgi:Ubiquinone biosynthesis hydroxylase, UbiH/UbiF/VisC/COQ6 family|nr:FAD-dependent monooxygenase [Betaproteobacteria bacterium]
MDGGHTTPLILVGGGPVGTATAIGLVRAGIPVRLLEARPSLRAADQRTLALTQGSREFLEGLGAWPHRGVTPIDEIHVSQRGRWGQTVLERDDGTGQALGYVLLYNTLMAHLDEVARSLPGLSLEMGAEVTEVIPDWSRATVVWCAAGQEQRADSPLVLVADGGRGLTERVFGAPHEKAYDQVALVARVETDQDVRHRAFERFTAQGPVALLPLEGRYTLIWTGTREVTEERLAWAESHFLAHLQEVFGDRAGNFRRVEARNWFPLSLRVLGSVMRPRCLALGNAAQTMHPVAGQGLNMGLRDAATLVDMLRDGQQSDLGSATQLASYVAARRRDRYGGIGLTHALVTLFSNDWPILSEGRSMGLAALNALPWARRTLTRVMSFGF